MDESRRCKATTKSTGKQCTQVAIIGGTVCRMHGGSAPQVRAKARERAFQTQILARLAVESESMPAVADPFGMISRLTGEAHLLVEMLRAKVAEIDELHVDTVTGAQEVKVLVLLYERALDRAQKFAADMIRLGIEDRLARVNERQVELVRRAVDAWLAEQRWDAEQMAEARRGIARHLRALPS